MVTVEWPFMVGFALSSFFLLSFYSHTISMNEEIFVWNDVLCCCCCCHTNSNIIVRPRERVLLPPFVILVVTLCLFQPLNSNSLRIIYSFLYYSFTHFNNILFIGRTDERKKGFCFFIFIFLDQIVSNRNLWPNNDIWYIQCIQKYHNLKHLLLIIIL